MVTATHIKSPEYSNVEGEQLQWDDREDALYAVHCARHRDAAVGALQSVLIVALADDDWATLWGRGEWQGQYKQQVEHTHASYAMHTYLGTYVP